MVGLDPLVLDPHIIQCVEPLADNMFCTLGSNRDFPLLRCMVLFHVWTSFLLLAVRPYVGVGATVRI